MSITINIQQKRPSFSLQLQFRSNHRKVNDDDHAYLGHTGQSKEVEVTETLVLIKNCFYLLVMWNNKIQYKRDFMTVRNKMN